MKPAVVVMAYGSPASEADIPAYLADIREGRPVSPGAVEELTERQRAALEHELDLPVFAGMKHSRPRIAEAVEQALEGGAGLVAGLVLAPHYSRLSVEGYRERLESALGERAELRFVESWHAHEPYLDVLADRVRGTDAHVVFTAHSLPARILEQGDPYEEQLLETSRLVAERAALERWSFAYQSASATGEPWLGPDLLEELDALAERGVRKVLVAPIGFVSDH